MVVQMFRCTSKGFPHLAGGRVLGDEAHKGDHGQAAVLDLLELVLLEGLGTASTRPASASEE